MRMRPSRAAARAGWLAGALALALWGCGDAADEGTPALAGGEPPGEGGTLVWTVADRVFSADPLTAETRAERIVTRQIHEPLTATVTGPFADTRRVAGLVRNARPSGDATIWTMRLRPGVRFQDGQPFNAAAVLANAKRWTSTLAGQALVPEFVVDAPRSDVVRFILPAPDPVFPRRLDVPQLGIVSPAALSGGSFTTGTIATGTGPFELRERGGASALLAPHVGWWAAESGNLGPAVDRVVVRTEPSASLRLALLDTGEAQLADELGPDQARLARTDPLLTVLRGGPGTWLGIERSVRGVRSAREIPSLAGAWLTTVTVAD